MKLEDLKIESHPSSSSKGGQHVGRIETGVKVTHVPTKIEVAVGTERSQLKNKNIAMSMLEWGLSEIGWVDSN